ncbi:LOW QUALITY PROTEIN: leucine-rich repeat LGI family member 4-like, partial [Heliangelus exortis]|uniref:LOW QUALITY PROTEIN: leucine-rich repeat LGI family member 4-like n=1 Tax=Heliangelus exortis TaxID=472823 RepID=UPI003A951E8B
GPPPEAWGWRWGEGLWGGLQGGPPLPLCPRSCECDRDSAQCRGGEGLPRGFPPRIATLSLLRCDLHVLPEGGFRDTPALQLLLIAAGRVGTIGDGAFAGLVLLEYLFIEDNEVGTIAPTALRGLRGLRHLCESLANNGLETLPKGLFQGLETLSHLDLRGNPFLCDCRLRWVLSWVGSTHAPPHRAGALPGPPPRQGTPLGHLNPRDFHCTTTELRPFQSLPFSSLAAEAFTLGGHPGVALAQPLAGACALLEWDQLEGRFRAPIVINGSSPVACHPLQLGGTLVLVVAQLGGGSAVWRRAGGPGGRFVRLQALGPGRLRRPHAVSSARLGGHWYLGVADSSKGGTSTLFRWGGRGFYPHQTLRPWHRDTHLEFLELGGRPALVLCSGSRRPLVYRWSGAAFAPHTDIPHVPDVYAAKHFRLRGHVYLCLSRFLGDAKVMRWEGSMFREVQEVPARGSLVFQPLNLGGHRYVLLGNDFAPSRLFRLGPGGHLEALQDLLTPTPRAFAPISVGPQHFLVAASFKGTTRIYSHQTLDGDT